MNEEHVPTSKKLSWAVGNIGGLAIGQASILLLYTYYFLLIYFLLVFHLYSSL